MATKRNIRKELEERTFKESVKYFKKTLSFLFSCDKRQFISTMVFNFITFELPIVSLFFLQKVIDGLVEQRVDVTALLILVIVIMLTRVSDALWQLAETKVQFSVSSNAEKVLYNKITDLRIEDFENKELHNNKDRAENAANSMVQVFWSISDILFRAIKVVSYIVIIFYWNSWIGLTTLIIPAIMIFNVFKTFKELYIQSWELIETRRKSYYYSHLMSKLQTLRELKILNVNDKYNEKFKNYLDEKNKNQLNIELEYTKQGNKKDFLDGALQIFYLVFLVYETISLRITLGQFNTYRTALQSSSEGLNYITNQSMRLSINLLEAKEFFDFLEYDNEYVDGTIKIKSIDSIEFKNVSFKYKNASSKALEKISFKIGRGDKVALIGENGSGKTTVMSLIMKVYKPTSGKIFINGIDINDIQTSTLRNKITMLMQEYNYFDESVKENILLDNRKISNKKLYEKIPFPELVEKIKSLPQKANTILGDWFGDGIKLSKGQNQKLVLSRIFSRDVDCFILDEPNSALDPRSEKTLFKYIENGIKNKICISTLHVFTNIDIMNKVIMFQNGKKLCEGTHKELYGNNKDYTEFYNLQEREEELMET